ncbi:MAG: WecB/TagA/CpsF family glycosyltransferase [Candidatus Omnitrophica bacterium]|nr:WecB/TagA/CpsF family glycosyltransferase [Candidatus Omnitrophota bacterium]
MRNYIFDIPLDSFSLEEIKEKVLNNHRLLQISVNVHKIVLFHKNNELKKLVSEKTAVFSVDGRWVQFFARVRGFRTTRFGGLEVIDNFFSLAQEMPLKIYLLGAREEIVKKTATILTLKFPGANIAGFRNGFFYDKEEIVKDIRDKGANILFLALPSPEKELLGFELFKKIESLKYVTGVGGAFDVIAGASKRAPKWVQATGLEWLYRCIQEPQRLAKRYFFDTIDLARIFLMSTSFLQVSKTKQK